MDTVIFSFEIGIIFIFRDHMPPKKKAEDE